MELWVANDKRSQSIQIRGNVHIANKGNSTATDVFVKVKAPFNVNLQQTNWNQIAGRVNEFIALRPIHPGLEVDFLVDTVMADEIQPWPQEHESLTAEIAIYARDTDPITWNFLATHTQVKDAERFHRNKLTIHASQAS